MTQTTESLSAPAPLAPGAAEAQYAAARNTALVAGVFTAMVCAVLLGDFARRTVKDPFEAPEFKALKAELAAAPDDEALKQQVRAVDLELRRRHFRHRRFAAFGAVLLLGGAAATLAAGKWASVLRRRLPRPGPQTGPVDAETGAMELARVGVAALAGVLVGAAAIAGLAFPSLMPTEDEIAARALPPAPDEGTPSRPPEEKPGPGEAASGSKEKPDETAVAHIPAAPDPAADRDPAFAPDEERAKYWPRFRGPDGSGISAYAAAPTSWDAASGKGIAWKTPVPLPGNNSPVVWKDRVFLSGADEKRREVYSFDAVSGKLLWQRGVPGTPESAAKPPEVAADTGFAAPTLATDGRRVFAVFANGDAAAFDFEGRLVWARSLGIPENHYGHAASLETWKDLVFVQIDQGTVKEGKSKIMALRAASGETAWEKKREAAASWSTPLVIGRGAAPQLIATAEPWVMAYNPADGAEIWRARRLSGEHGVSPVVANGVVQVGNEYCKWSAIRADGRGDVTETHVLWTGEDGLPDMCSPLATDKHVMILMTYGTLTCYAAGTGEVLWIKDFDGVKFTSSPGMAAGRVYLFGEIETDQDDPEGDPIKHCKTWVLEPGDKEAKELGTCLLDEGCVTSPAFQDGRIYVRGKKHLFCLGE